MASFRSAPNVICVLLALILTTAMAVPRFLKEGARCSDDGVSGICTRVRHCQPALRAIAERRPLPDRCSFAGHEEVVCCSDGKPDVLDREVNGNDISAGDRETRDDVTTKHNNVDVGGRWEASPGVRRSVAACNDFKTKQNGLDYYILFGTNALAQEYPHMAALGYKVPDTEGLSWLCGGTLISDQYVVTAAHCCTSRVTKRPLRVQLGKVNLTSAEDDSQYRITDIIVHSNYKKRQYYSDIALLKLDRKVKFSEFVFPACLYTQETDPPKFTATGWGATDAAGTRLSSSLLKTTISPFQLSQCQSIYQYRFPNGLDSSLICAGDPEGKADTCVGDSGGPLVVGTAAPYSIVGLTSLGPKPCGGSVPSIYTRVASYLSWIEERVWP